MGWPHRAVLAAVLLAGSACSREHAAVELWAMGREGELVEQLVPGFRRRYPDIEVRVQQVPWSAAHEKLLTAFVGDAMPDVFQLGNTWLPELVALGAVDSIDERAAGHEPLALDDFFPGVLDTNRIDGALYAVPWYVDTRILFYRADLLAAAGYAEPPRTWTEWVAAMEAIKARAGTDRFAILLPIREWQMPVILALQRGANLLRDRDQYGDFRSAAFRGAFEFYVDLFRRGLTPRTGATQVANVYQDFADGFFTFYVTGPWNLEEFAHRLPDSLQNAWATAPMPAPDDRYPGVSLAGGASLAVSNGSRRKDAAWALIRYLTEPAQQVAFARLSGDLPSSRRAWEDAALRDDPRARAFWQQLQSLRSTPKIPEWERVATRIAQVAERAVRGDVGIDEALIQLDADVDRLLEKRRWLLRERGGADVARSPAPPGNALRPRLCLDPSARAPGELGAPRPSLDSRGEHPSHASREVVTDAG